MLSNYDINWYDSLMFLDSGNLTFVFSKGSNSVAELRVCKPREITLFGIYVRSEFINQGK